MEFIIFYKNQYIIFCIIYSIPIFFKYYSVEPKGSVKKCRPVLEVLDCPIVIWLSYEHSKNISELGTVILEKKLRSSKSSVDKRN